MRIARSLSRISRRRPDTTISLCKKTHGAISVLIRNDTAGKTQGRARRGENERASQRKRPCEAQPPDSAPASQGRRPERARRFGASAARDGEFARGALIFGPYSAGSFIPSWSNRKA